MLQLHKYLDYLSAMMGLFTYHSGFIVIKIPDMSKPLLIRYCLCYAWTWDNALHFHCLCTDNNTASLSSQCIV